MTHLELALKGSELEERKTGGSVVQLCRDALAMDPSPAVMQRVAASMSDFKVLISSGSKGGFCYSKRSHTEEWTREARGHFKVGREWRKSHGLANAFLQPNKATWLKGTSLVSGLSGLLTAHLLSFVLRISSRSRRSFRWDPQKAQRSEAI